MWEAVQIEMERRRNFVLRYGIQKWSTRQQIIFLRVRVICGSCGQIFGRKVYSALGIVLVVMGVVLLNFKGNTH
ncbi:hypothetical protein [Lucifera butyrica]|uniref:hypothetical protein n=1 Tax=Lucifera butyrica TaxID=1351585 RepID=UPI001A9FC2A0|nr:hypothetical protein [Lucifera butyrica]